MDQLPSPPASGATWPAADAAYLNLARSGLGCALAGTVLTLFFTCCAALGAIWPERFLVDGGGGAAPVIAAVIAVVFGLMAVVMVLGLLVSLRRNGLAVDRSGIWFVLAKRAEPVPWQRIRAIGGSWREKKRAYKSSLGARIGQEIMRRALTEDGRHMFAVEVFLHDPEAAAGTPPFAQHLRTTGREQPPAHGLPAARLRFNVGAIRDYREMATHLQRRAPELWIGEYQRT